MAIDRATRWVFVRIYPAQTAANARRFLRDLEGAAPMKITRVLTDNGKAFTDRLFGLRKRSPTGQHEFDRLCADLRIEHRLTPPMRPQTNGMVERFQRPDRGRVAKPPLRRRRGPRTHDPALRPALQRTAPAISAERLEHPSIALRDWQRASEPELLQKSKRSRINHTGKALSL